MNVTPTTKIVKRTKLHKKKEHTHYDYYNNFKRFGVSQNNDFQIFNSYFIQHSLLNTILLCFTSHNK